MHCGDGFMAGAFPFEWLMGGNWVHVEKSSQFSLGAGNDAHASAQRAGPERGGKRLFDKETGTLAAGVEFRLEADVLEPADVIRMQMADVNVGNIPLGKTLSHQRPTNIRTAIK